MTTDPVWAMKVGEKNHQYQPQFAGGNTRFARRIARRNSTSDRKTRLRPQRRAALRLKRRRPSRSARAFSFALLIRQEADGRGGSRHLVLAMCHCGLVHGFAGLESGIAFVDFVPVDDVPPGGEIFRASVVVFELIGVLPDVIAEDRQQAWGKRVVLVRSAKDLHFAGGFARHANASAAELFYSGIVELGLKILEVAEGFGDHFGDRAVRVASTFGLHDLPEHAVVDVASAVVADGGADVFGNRGGAGDQIFTGLGGS